MAAISAWISVFLSILSMRARSTLRILPRMGRIAWVFGFRASLAEPPAELPSTMNSSHSRGRCDEQSTSLPGRPAPSSADLRRVRSRAERAAMRARAAWSAFWTIWLASRGFSSNHSASFSLVARSTSERIGDVAELGLGLALELRVAQADRDDGGEALADVLAQEVVVLLLEQVPWPGRSC